MFVIKHKRIFLGISVLLVLLSVCSIFVYGLRPSIDFVGGVIVEVSYPEGRGDVKALETELSNSTLNLGAFSLRPSGENAVTLRARSLSETEGQTLLNIFSNNDTVEIVVERFNNVGPAIGEELRRKAFVALALVVLVIILFITFVFRGVSKPVASWKYGLVAIVALIHDVMIPTGIFALLGNLYGYEVDTLFVTALLAIFGYSVADTIVIFDRIRENLKKKSEYRGKESFEETVGISLKESAGRSFNTSLTTGLALIALYVFGPDSTNHFALTLLVGIIAGTYSSIFLASPLLVLIERWQKKV